MAAERQANRGKYVNETGTRQAQASEIFVVETVAAGGGAAPTLSSPTVTSIGQTTATPQVTVTFA